VDKMVRNLSIGLILLIIFVPLGLLAAGAAYGEWAPDELKDRIGFVPHGLEELSDLWHAPLQDYNIPLLLLLKIRSWYLLQDTFCLQYSV
jgi:hypothetical protein